MSRFLSIIVPTYNRPALLRSCLQSLCWQTCLDFEVIVVCNGSPPDTHKVVESFCNLLPKLKIVTIKNNIWDWSDVGSYYGIVYKLGLNEASGNFSLFLSDDDSLTPRFVEIAQRDIRSHPLCVAFTGAPLSANLLTGEICQVSSRYLSHRPRIESGVELSLRYFSPNSKKRRDLSDPGFGYAVKTSLYKEPKLQELIWSGGYETPQYLALIPHGLVAFNERAKYVWGRHPDQANILMNQQIGMLRQYEKIRRKEMRLAIPLWREYFGLNKSLMLKKSLKNREGYRRLKFIWEAHEYDAIVQSDLRKTLRQPWLAWTVLKSDGRELIFWSLLPRAASTIFKYAFRRVAACFRG